MKNVNCTITALVALVGVAGFDLQTVAAEPGPSQAAAARQAALDDILKDDPLVTVTDIRWTCASGREVSAVAERRRAGAYFTPDAADRCVTALVRIARERRLSELYSKLLIELGGSKEGFEQLPQVIGAAVMKGPAKVPIGNGKAAEVTPALSLDAGFTAAYLDTGAKNPGTADQRQLKVVAESCLAQGQDAGTCFSVGYMFGAQAVRSGSGATGH